MTDQQMTTKLRRIGGGKQAWETRKKNQQEKERVKNMTPDEYKEYRRSKGMWV